MIKTRNTIDTIDVHGGDGDIVIAVTAEELELMGAMLCMIKLGHRPYQKAAKKLLDTLTEVSGDSDYSLSCFSVIDPCLEVSDMLLNTIAVYDSDNIFQIVV
jgi:hypothetical protein